MQRRALPQARTFRDRTLSSSSWNAQGLPTWGVPFGVPARIGTVTLLTGASCGFTGVAVTT